MRGPRSTRYVTLAGLLLALAIAARPVMLAALAARAEYQALHPIRQVPARPGDANALALELVRLVSLSGDSVRGWYVPGRSGAAVLLAHGSGADRSQMLAAARRFQRAGIGSLLLDAPGTGESGGRVTLGESERRAWLVGLEYLLGRPEVDRDRVGAYGFSAGALTVLQLAGDARVRAVALAACPTDLRSVTQREYARSGRLAQWAALALLRREGIDLDHGQPIDIIARIGDRPLLLVSGAADSLVPPSNAVQLSVAAGHATRLLVPALDHSEPMTFSSQAAQRIVDFFVAALAKR